MEPILKWPGGKRKLVPVIREHLPARFNRYFEPFCGGAALFFFVEPQNAILCDRNLQLIECYQRICIDPEGVITILESLPNTEAEYYRIRSWQPIHPNERAARMLYLCRLSFNGIYRVNQNGEHNVPYGRKTHLLSCDATAIRTAAQLLRNATLLHGDFSEAVCTARTGDLIYFDPPYTVAHSRNGFIKYNDHLFSWQDQKRLATTALELRRKGCFVLVSNADHQTIRDLYPDFREVIINRQSSIAASNDARKKVTESLFISIPADNHNEA